MKSKNNLGFCIVLFINVLLIPGIVTAQFAPPAGQPGTTAMNRDSSAFIDWASTCTIERGYINIADTTVIYFGSNKAAYGNFLYATGPADDLVVSLGDHGSATLGFEIPISNMTGPDFAVFENSFNDSFLELGFVEVSSDGLRYVRFPSVSLTPDNQQVGTFDTIDAAKINNLAGKYRHGYGTPFDLDDIRDSLGIDLENIIRIRIVDVVGCLQDAFATTDSQGHKINDPWPTPFDTGGIDLDAVGVIHNKTAGRFDNREMPSVSIYPNPVSDKVTFSTGSLMPCKINISDPEGKNLMDGGFSKAAVYDLSELTPGLYLACFSFPDGSSVTKKIIKN